MTARVRFARGRAQGVMAVDFLHTPARASPRPRCAMSETYQDIVARLPSETELIRRMIHSLRRTGKTRYIAPLWKRVSDATGNGRGFSSAICTRYGFDPDEEFMPPGTYRPTGPLID